MQKVTITNLSGVVTNEAQFDTLDQAQSWLDYHSAQRNFIFQDIYETSKDMDGNDVVVLAAAKAHNYVISDISAQVNQDKINADALAFLASTDWMVLREMDGGTPCPADIKQARAEARAKVIR